MRAWRMQDMKGRIQVGFISRPRSKGMSRAVVNEQELMQALQEKYHDVADVKLLHFNTSLAEAMLVVNRTDILIGIHGAGGSSPDMLCRQSICIAYSCCTHQSHAFNLLVSFMRRRAACFSGLPEAPEYPSCCPLTAGLQRLLASICHVECAVMAVIFLGSRCRIS